MCNICTYSFLIIKVANSTPLKLGLLMVFQAPRNLFVILFLSRDLQNPVEQIARDDDKQRYDTKEDGDQLPGHYLFE